MVSLAPFVAAPSGATVPPVVCPSATPLSAASATPVSAACFSVGPAPARSFLGWSLTACDLLGVGGELQDALPEVLEVGVVGHAGERALVVALHEHGHLPHRQRDVPAQVTHRAPGALLVAREQLRARGEAVGLGDR